MRLNFFSFFTALILLAACETAPEKSAAGSGAGGATAPAASSGSGAAGATGAAATRRPLSEQFAQLGDRILFDYAKFNLKPEARNRISEWAKILRENPQAAIFLEGNCDERGTREYNLALGERRANSVRDYLVGLGIATNRITTISYGKERPVATGSNEAGWAQNRNTRIVAN
ncbi:MAG: peptidoglycan-associated lipoprotein Pal [Alphaproteobacteria bacterium]|nr:peptidoglycan-associated lipoprotein Pal [Alphaproteobacteria bacterium]